MLPDTTVFFFKCVAGGSVGVDTSLPSCSFSLMVDKAIQWNLRTKDTLGAELLSSFRRLSFGGRIEPICNL